MRVKQDSGSSHSVLSSRAGSWTLGCRHPYPLSLPLFQLGRVSTREERNLKEEGGLLLYPSLLYPPYEEDWGEMPPLLKTSFLGSLSLFLGGESPILVQLGMLCDLTGVAGADSFVEGLCVHSHYANGTSSSLPINYEHWEMFPTIPSVPARETPQVRGHTCFDFLIWGIMCSR